MNYEKGGNFKRFNRLSFFVIEKIILTIGIEQIKKW